jgi:hypothetical protein
MGHLRLCVYLSSLVLRVGMDMCVWPLLLLGCCSCSVVSVLVLLCVNPVLILLGLLPTCPVFAPRLLLLWVYLRLLLGRELVWLYSVAPSVLCLVGSRNVHLVKWIPGLSHPLWPSGMLRRHPRRLGTL